MMATPEDLKAIDSIFKPKEPPERLYGWFNSQLSIARFYGGCTYQGHSYVIDPVQPNPPLVRIDVLKREEKERSDKKKADRAARKLAERNAQLGLI